VFFIGLLCGVVLCLTVRAVLLEWMPPGRPNDPRCQPVPAKQKSWDLTRNFLYYDGTVMPEIKEDVNE